MDIQKFERDFLAANAKTAVTVMNATGWQEGIVNGAAVNVDAVFLYAFDHQSDMTWACSVPRDNFLSLVATAQAMPEAVRAAFPGMCAHSIAKAASRKQLDDELENQLGIALSAYLSMTELYRLTERATKANHFTVIHYGATGFVRPYAAKGPARHLIPSDEIQSGIKHVVALDAERHPEWLSKAHGKPCMRQK